jgi:hypothetical protein
MIEPITVFSARCDHEDHAGNPDDDGLHRWDGDETTIWGSRDEALTSIRTEGWQATVAGTFCPAHVTDSRPLEQPSLDLFESVAFDALVEGLADDYAPVHGSGDPS